MAQRVSVGVGIMGDGGGAKALAGDGVGVTEGVAMACATGVTAGRAACGIFIIKMTTPMPSTQMSAMARTASKIICLADMQHLSVRRKTIPDALRNKQWHRLEFVYVHQPLVRNLERGDDGQRQK